jgi:hypothetical protein
MNQFKGAKMVKIAKDTPKELLDLGIRLNFTGNKDDVAKKVLQLKDLASKYVPLKRHKIEYVDFNIDNKFQPLANLISRLDFASLPSLSKRIGLAYIENYLKLNGFLK